MLILGYLLTALGAYLLGSIPTGFLVAKSRGVDIRAVGSGNIGATNVFRSLGKTAGAFVFLVDAAKGYAACAIIGGLCQGWFCRHCSRDLADAFPILAGFLAVVGHNFTCWLRFKGGKGMATSAGVLLALFPKALLVVAGIWVVVFALGRFVSLASVAAAFWLPVVVWAFDYSDPRIAVALILGVLAIYKHRSNIQRLVAGSEPRIGDKRNVVVDATPEAK